MLKKRELKKIGDTIGKIFQVTDDMLDRWGNEKKVGKKIKKGDLFIAIKGKKFDGHKFIDEAVKNGASAVISEKKPQLQPISKTLDLSFNSLSNL